MTITEILDKPDWDTPFFKRLAKNDTGAANSNQSGMVLLKELRPYLPRLNEADTSKSAPTTDRRLSVELFMGTIRVAGITEVRYQFQTRGAKRAPESWITHPKGELGWHPLWDIATSGDVIIFQRRLDAIDRFRMILVQKRTPEFAEIATVVNSRRGGPLYLDNQPVTQAEFTSAINAIDALAQQPFEVLLPQVKRVVTRQNRVARTCVFSDRIRREYQFKCAVSGIFVVTPAEPHELYEVESAHIVPLNKGGSDDFRNGLALTQTLHWAFDHGLFGITPARTIYLPKRVRTAKSGQNVFLHQYQNKPISEAKTQSLRAHCDAFDWHMEHLVKQWDT